MIAVDRTGLHYTELQFSNHCCNSIRFFVLLSALIYSASTPSAFCCICSPLKQISILNLAFLPHSLIFFISFFFKSRFFLTVISLFRVSLIFTIICIPPFILLLAHLFLQRLCLTFRFYALSPLPYNVQESLQEKEVLSVQNEDL